MISRLQFTACSIHYLPPIPSTCGFSGWIFLRFCHFEIAGSWAGFPAIELTNWVLISSLRDPASVIGGHQLPLRRLFHQSLWVPVSFTQFKPSSEIPGFTNQIQVSKPTLIPLSICEFHLTSIYSHLLGLSRSRSWFFILAWFDSPILLSVRSIYHW